MVALVFFYGDNIVKIFANSATVIVSAIVDQILFHKGLSVQIGIAGSIIFLSTVTFYGDHSTLLKEDSDFIACRNSDKEKSKDSTNGGTTKGGIKRKNLLLPKIATLPLLIGFSLCWIISSIYICNQPMDTAATELPSLPPRRPNNIPCDWPPPLYHSYKHGSTDPNFLQSVRLARQYFDSYPNTTFSYIDSGGALGVMRDGGLIPGDSDLDVRYGICEPCKPKPGKLPEFNRFVSANNFERWGDVWTRRQFEFKVDKIFVEQVQQDLCLHEYAPGEQYWFHRYALQRRAFLFTYGDFWFMRLPFKGVHNLHVWEQYANEETPDGFACNWKRTCDEIQKMDLDNDSSISVEELDQRVLADNIIPKQYNDQISARERCRAAALMTFMLKFRKEPFDIPKGNHGFTNGDHPLFRFPECDDL